MNQKPNPHKQWEQQLTMNQQQQNNCIRTDNRGNLVVLKCTNMVQIFTIDSAVVETQKLLSLHGG